MCVHPFIYICGKYATPPPRTLVCDLGQDYGPLPAILRSENTKKIGSGVGWDSGKALYKVFGLKIGYGITAVRMITRVLKITTKS